MSSQLRKNQSDEDNSNESLLRTSSMRKSKKKKKLGIFSFRSKKTKTISNNNVMSEQSDTISVSSEISTTEDMGFSATSTWTERHITHATVTHSSQDTHTIRGPSDTTAHDATHEVQPTKEPNGETDAVTKDLNCGVNGNDDTGASTVTITKEAITVVTAETEDDHAHQASNLSQPQEATDSTREQRQSNQELEQHSPQKGNKSDTPSDRVLHAASGIPNRPNSIRLQQNGGANSLTKPQSSFARRQKFFVEQQSSSTECSSHPVSPVKGRFKSKKLKMPHPGATHRLTVRLLSGQGLAARDSNGLSDPYVKFKLASRTLYKSKICKATLNPKWDEQFIIPVRLSDEIAVRVFDRDIGMRDDFMGSSSFDIQSLMEKEETELSLDLVDEEATVQEELGRIHLAVTLVPIMDDIIDGMDMLNSPEDYGDTISVASLKVNSISRSDSNASDISRRTTMSEKCRKTKAPIGMATVQLVSGKGLPARDSNGLSDPYVKLQMGKQRQRSKVCPKTLNPVWKDEFVFHLTNRESFDRDPAILDMTVWDKDSYRKDDFIGRCELDLGSLEYDKTYEFNLSLKDAQGSILLLVTLHSCFPSESMAMNNQFLHVKENYSLVSTFSDISDIGRAEVKIIRVNGCRAADIGGKSDPFCVVELCNARSQTHTCYKTLDPVWNKSVTFPIKDIHDVFVFTVYDEDKDGNDFLGKLAIPLLRASNGVERTYTLKDRKLLGRTKGTITIQFTYIYNPARAAIRTFSPREEKHMDVDAKFKRQLLMRNFSRVWACVQAVLQMLEFVNSCFTWENPTRSATAFIVYLLVVWNIELYMLPILLLLLLMKSYFDVVVQKTKVDRRLSINPEESFQDDDDDDDIDDTNNKVSLLQRLKAIEEVLLKVQNILDWIASLLERISNTFAWSVPFLSTLAVIVLSIVTVILYFVSLRTIALLWGINKFTKRLRKPNYIPNNELLDFLSRIPSEVELDQFQELPILQGSPKGYKKKK